MCQREVYCPVNPMLFPWVVAVRQRDCWHSIQMQLLSRGRDGGESGFQMFLGASAVGETPLPASEDAYQEEHRCSLMELTHPSSLGFLSEKTLLGPLLFSIAFVLLSEFMCVCVCFFLKGTLV